MNFQSVIGKNTFSEVIAVRQSSDFGVIDSTKLYVIDGIVDMTGVSIEIPAEGFSFIRVQER